VLPAEHETHRNEVGVPARQEHVIPFRFGKEFSVTHGSDLNARAHIEAGFIH